MDLEAVRSSPTQFQSLLESRVADATTYPQVFVNGEHIGGADDLESWLSSGGRKAA